jgi:hypothetical protein
LIADGRRLLCFHAMLAISFAGAGLPVKGPLDMRLVAQREPLTALRDGHPMRYRFTPGRQANVPPSVPM